MHEAAATWEDAVYNLARPLKTLRIDLTGPLNGKPGRRWRPRTPAMAAGLTDEVWRIEQLLQSVVPLIRQHVRGPLPGFVRHRDVVGAVNIRKKYLGQNEPTGSSLQVAGEMASPTGVRYRPHMRCKPQRCNPASSRKAAFQRQGCRPVG